jgi:hypothetical protein
VDCGLGGPFRPVFIGDPSCDAETASVDWDALWEHDRAY